MVLSNKKQQPFYFTRSSLVFVLLAIIIFWLWSRHIMMDSLFQQAEKINVFVTRTLSNALLVKYPELLSKSQQLDISGVQSLLSQEHSDLKITKIKIYSLDGMTLFSTKVDEVGIQKKINEGIRVAGAGQVYSEFSQHHDHDKKNRHNESIFKNVILSSYIPLYNTQGDIEGVFEIHSDISLLVDQIKRIEQGLIIAFVFVSSIVALTLFLIARYTDKVILKQQERIEHKTNYDKLTDLPNRELFWDRLHLAIAHAKRDEKLVALFRVNLDRFKHINNGMGHQFADQVLQQVARRMQSSVRACDTIARIGGDDFAFIIGEIDRKDEIEDAVKRIIAPLHQGYEINGQDIIVTTSIGISVYPSDQSIAEEMLKAADAALNQAKGQGGNRYIFYTPEMGVSSAARLNEERSLRKALQNNEFKLHYQPKVDSTTGNIKGFEALLRWYHPERGIISPLEFIPILEESGLIIPAGEWVIQEACLASRRWLDSGLPAMPVSINVSSSQFQQKGFTDRIRQILNETGTNPGCLEIELTESCLMDNVQENIDTLKELKDLGLSIAVDDFGTGYSSLSYLKRFSIDTLKIDRSFITNINKRHENDNAGIVTAIMALSHSLRMEVVAEGVETAQELAYLHALGCRTIQGFLFSRPLTEEQVVELMQESICMNEVMESVRQELKL